MLRLVGKGSTFGGPYDDPGAGNDRDDWKTEGLSIIKEEDLKLSHVRGLFLDKPVKGMTGLARRLNPDRFYVACRWDYKITPRAFLRDCLVTVTCLKNGRRANARPVDWGPAEWTGKKVDMSPGLMDFLGGDTGDEFEVLIPQPGDKPAKKEEPYKPPPDPRDVYKNSPADPPGKGAGIVGNLIGQIALPLLFTVGGSLLKKFVTKKLGKVVGPVLETEKEKKGSPGPIKEDHAVEKILSPEQKKGDLGDVLEAIVRALVQGIVGTINQKYQTKDWSGEVQSDGVEGVLKRLLS